MSESERPTLRVFISSPSDVRPERLIAERVVRRLDQEFALHLDLRAVMWERQPLLASHHFQELITPPHETDIAVVILWSRLGTPLPAGSDESTLQANSGKIAQAITSPKGNLIFGPWNQTEYYLSVGQGFHSNDLRGALTNVDALATEINSQQGNPTVVTQEKTPLLTKATGYELGVHSRTSLAPAFRTTPGSKDRRPFSNPPARVFRWRVIARLGPP
jgi:hypothetical protein